jgi:carnitine-CoA ligase
VREPATPESAADGITIDRLLDRWAQSAPDDPYLITEAATYTYRQARARSDSTAAALRALGVERGDRIVAMLPNCAEFLFLLFGAARLGAVLAPINPAATTSELIGIVRQAEPAVVVFDELTQERSEAAKRARPGITCVDLQSATASGGGPVAPVARPEDTALLISTSGSTSAPKLAAHAHTSLVLGAEGFPFWLGLSRADRLLTPLPLFHANALVYTCLGATAIGASLVVLDRFSASRFWQQTCEFGVTQFNLLGKMAEILLRTAEHPGEVGNPVRVCYSALAPPRERQEAFEARFGVDVMVGYGLSESFYGTVWPSNGSKPFGTIGYLRQHPRLGTVNTARVVDDDGRPVPAGEVGSLLLRNPATMQGYFGMPEATAQVLHDGWLDTGDLVRRDTSGLFTFVARRKEIIRRSSENFAPVEVEEALDTLRPSAYRP